MTPPISPAIFSRSYKILQLLKTLQRKKLEEELLQARKMEAIGRLAGGVAHDFNNLLTVITGYCARILQRSGDEDTLRLEVGQISMAANRAAALTAKLLAFSRRQVLQRRITNLTKTIVEVRELIRRLIGEDIELIITVEPGLGLAEADESQIGQVIINLAVNARDAMPAGGTLSIHLGNVFLSEEYALSHLGVCSGRYLALSVRDTGCGMDAETQARMFEPFFTTKEIGKGTGLGLSTVYGIVKEHGGHVSVESAPRKGTTIAVYLPRVEGAIGESEMVHLSTRTGGTERILVVEDDIQLRQLTVEVLRGAGYAVLEADNGERALELIARDPGPIDLILTDIVMPRMNGRVLAEQVLSSGKCGAVLYMSGYAGEGSAHVEAIPADAPLLVKPFTPEQLLERVRRMLDAGSGATDRGTRD